MTKIKEEVRFGPVVFIPGDNGGRYPLCHSLYVEAKFKRDHRSRVQPAEAYRNLERTGSGRRMAVPLS